MLFLLLVAVSGFMNPILLRVTGMMDPETGTDTESCTDYCDDRFYNATTCDGQYSRWTDLCTDCTRPTCCEPADKLTNPSTCVCVEQTEVRLSIVLTAQ